MKGRKKLRGLVCGIAGGICWGFSGCCGQYLFEQKNVPSGWLTAVRLLCAGIILLLVSVIAQRQNLTAALRDRRDLMRILSFGVFGLMLCQLSYLTAISYTNAATATVIQYVGPVLVMLVVCVGQKRLPHFFEGVSVLLALTGTYLLATHGDPGSLAISPRGLFWCIAAALSVVFYTLIPGYVVAKRSSVVVNGVGMLAGGLVLAAVFRIWRIPQGLDAAAWLAIAAIVVVGTVLAFSLYLQAVSDIGPIQASVISSVEPVSSAVISFLWLKTSFSPMDLLGFFLIVSTVFLLAIRGKNRRA